MARVKKNNGTLSYQEERQKLLDEIDKYEKKVADTRLKLKKLDEKKQSEQLKQISTSGYTLDDAVNIVEYMKENNLSAEELVSFLSGKPASDTTQEEKPKEPDMDDVMASLPSYE